MMGIHYHQNLASDTVHACPARLVLFGRGIGDHATLLLCLSLEYVTFLIVTPNMTSAHVINHRPLFTHLGEMTEDPSLHLHVLVFEMPSLWWEEPQLPRPHESCYTHT